MPDFKRISDEVTKDLILVMKRHSLDNMITVIGVQSRCQPISLISNKTNADSKFFVKMSEVVRKGVKTAIQEALDETLP